ncbi:hypothetical protein LLG46_01255 [bacterium]|nr:hypothetical protein [bacterium]
MAFIKTDPSQTKTVIALLVILVAAIGITAFRVSHKAPPPPVEKAQAQVQTANRAQAAVAPYIERETSRNPFARPMYIASAKQGVSIVDRNSSGRVLPANIKMNPWRADGVEFGHEKIAPMDVTQKRTTSVQIEAAKEPVPVFELMATISGPKGSSAVIKTDHSQSQVVDMGDRVTGGYKVVAIEPDHVILTDGRNTLFARRLMRSAESVKAQGVECVANDAE